MAKYMERRFVQRGGPSEPHRLRDAIHNRDLLALLQAFAEGHDLAKPLASPEGQVSCVHPKCPPPPKKKTPISGGSAGREHPWVWGSAQPAGCEHPWGQPCPPSMQQDTGELALHVAVRCADRSSLPLVDFIIQNGCVPLRPTATPDGPGAFPTRC